METIKLLPILPLRQMIVLPGNLNHFDVSRKKGILALDAAMKDEQLIFVVGQKNGTELPKITDLYLTGTVCKLKQLVKMPRGTTRVLLEGICRGKMESLEEDAFLMGDVRLSPSINDVDEPTQAAYVSMLGDLLVAYCQANPGFSKDIAKKLLGIQNISLLMDELVMHLPVSCQKRQEYLEADTVSEQYGMVSHMLEWEIEVQTIKKKLREQVEKSVEKNQRDFILREQIRIIQEELGENTPATEAEAFLKQVEQLDATEEVKTGIKKEIKRFQGLPANAPESSIVRTYLETVVEMPWNRVSEDCNDLKKARKQLEKDHYGLEKVKDRIMEFLAVRSFTKGKGDSPIICLVGPPGVGKTSIAKSVAKALNKEYVRISLGGVRDEAEIRGHRKTYIGAMPGRISKGLIQAGTANPVMLFDEIDKMASDYKGDPASAMLEVMDSEQNNRFRDNYIELPVDLSQVLFIATANDMQGIPGPLRDRMEIIEIGSYTANEKLHIAKEHLWAKQLERNGLDKSKLTITTKTIERVIDCYTREAGVRGLERKLAQICRKAASLLAEEQADKVKVTDKNLEEFLGKPVFVSNKEKKETEVGIVNGLAWTSVGGDTLQVEVNVMDGRGNVQMTGKLGDVMQESVQIAVSYIRSIARQYHIEGAFFRKHDIHVHVPEGAVPKDGPSAGITMATAILSAITDIPVKQDVAMTGEITLRGMVLPIGGLKEKLLAAKVDGMKTVCVPEANKRDVEEIDTEITEGLNIVYVKRMDTVLQTAFVKGEK
jgi:ATP-dependent Lon protease